MPVVGEIATGVAASFIFEGLKRPFALIQAEFQKRKNIGRALSDRPIPILTQQDRRIETIISDLARIIGNKEGKLTQAVANFLSELQRTALPQAVSRAALCNVGADTLLPAFTAFTSAFPDLPFTAEQLLNGLYVASKLRIDAVNDTALLEIIRAQHTELSASFLQVTTALAALTEHDNPLTIELIKETRLKVARSIEAVNRHITVETLRGSRKFSLKTLAIPGRLMELDASHIQSAKAPKEGSTTHYQAFRRALDRSVILGDPGGGKSTLTQLLSFDLANMIGLEANNPSVKEFDSYDLKLPLRIILRSFEAKQSKMPSYNFFDYVAMMLKLRSRTTPTSQGVSSATY